MNYELGCLLSLKLKPLMALVKGKVEAVERSLELPEQIASPSQIVTSSIDDDTWIILT